MKNSADDDEEVTVKMDNSGVLVRYVKSRLTQVVFIVIIIVGALYFFKGVLQPTSISEELVFVQPEGPRTKWTHKVHYPEHHEVSAGRRWGGEGQDDVADEPDVGSDAIADDDDDYYDDDDDDDDNDYVDDNDTGDADDDDADDIDDGMMGDNDYADDVDDGMMDDDDDADDVDDDDYLDDDDVDDEDDDDADYLDEDETTTSFDGSTTPYFTTTPRRVDLNLAEGKSVLDPEDLNVVKFDFSKLEPLPFLHDYKNPCFLIERKDPRFTPVQRTAYSTNPYLAIPSIAPYLAKQQKNAAVLSHEGSCSKFGCNVRCMPAFILVGLAKSETYEMFNLISSHPDVARPAVTDPYFWEEYRFEGMSLSHYLDLYDNASAEIHAFTSDGPGVSGQVHAKITGETSSSRLAQNIFWNQNLMNANLPEPKFLVAHDLVRTVPSLKTIFILRNPTDHIYWMYWNNPFVPFSSKSEVDFRNKFLASAGWWQNCTSGSAIYLRHCFYGHPPEMSKLYERSDGWWSISNTFLPFFRDVLYNIYLADWLQVFKQDQVLILNADEYVKDPAKTISQTVYKFLDLADFEPTMQYLRAEEERHIPEMSAEVRTQVNNFYAVFNNELYKLLPEVKDFNWEDGVPRKYPQDASCCALE